MRVASVNMGFAPICAVIFTASMMSSCRPETPPDNIEQPPSSVQNSDETVNNNTVEIAPLNCRGMLSLHSPNLRSGKKRLIIRIENNPNFDGAIGDVCKGDLRNLWPDIIRFNDELKSEDPYELWLSYITPNLNLFPKTHIEIAEHIDDAAKREKNNIRPETYDRTELDDALDLRRKYLELIWAETPQYFAANHTPILNKALAPYNLEMMEYSAGEKLSFCYMPWDNCVDYIPANKNLLTDHDRDWIILYAGSWDNWEIQKSTTD